MSWHHFVNEEHEEYGSFEVFYSNGSHGATMERHEPGWYWWPCFPGCMPDGDAQGPYKSEDEAIEAAQENA
jgi:hypothetical protein